VTSKRKNLFRVLPATRELLGAASRIRNSGFSSRDKPIRGCKGQSVGPSLQKTPDPASGSHEISSGRLQVPLEIDLFAIRWLHNSPAQVVEKRN